MLQRPDVDAVFIATPDQWHAPMILAAMQAGKDVYVEKPMTHTVEEAKVVAQKSAEMKRIVQVGVQGLSWRRWPKLKGIIQSGALGQVIAVQGTYSRNDPSGDWNWPIDAQAGPDATGDNHIDWKQWLGSAPEIPFNADRFFRFRKYWDYSGGIATDLHYHVVAPLLYAVGEEFPERVAGMGGRWVYNDGREVPDTFLTAADYASKYSLTVQSSQVNENGPTLMIRGTKATLHLSDEWEGAPSRQYDYADLIPEGPYAEEFAKKNQAEMVRSDGVGNDGDDLHVDNFIECVRSRKQPNCPVQLGYKTVATIDLSVRSFRDGKIYRYDNEKVVEASQG
jgi:predicted dehydrogenase